MIDERSSSSILRKTIFEPQKGIEPAFFSWPVRRSNHWATKILLLISSLTCSGFHFGLKKVKLAASLAVWVLVAQWLERLTGHQKVVGSIPRLGLRKLFFMRIELDDCSSYHLKNYQYFLGGHTFLGGQRPTQATPWRRHYLALTKKSGTCAKILAVPCPEC